MAKDKIDKVQYVKDRLTYLHTLKKPRFDKYWKYRDEYAQDNVNTQTEDGYTNYHFNVGFAVVETKTAEVYASTPKYDFVGIDEKGRQMKRMMEKFWEWVWKKSNTNKAVGQIIQDAFKYGSGFGRESFVTLRRNVRVPTVEGDKVTTRFEEKIDYKGCKLSKLEWHNVYLNGRSIEDTTEAIIITHWDKDEWEANVGNAYGVKASDVQSGKIYYVRENSNSLVTKRDTTRDSDTQTDNENTISQIEYFNKYKDEYIIIAGDKLINEGEDWLPDPHKEIPIVVYIDYEVDNDIYGRGEFDITEKTRLLIDDTRSTAMETVKLQGGIVTIAPDSDFDETVQKIGNRQFARINKEDLGHFVPNINISGLELISKNLSEDIIVETGVDFRGQIFGPNETAERTKGRIEAQRKRINKNIRDNAYTFYERLARLRMENMRVYYKSENMQVPVSGNDISEDGLATPVGNGEYGIMKLTDKILEGDVMLIPVIDSIYGDSSKEQKTKWLEVFQILINLKDKDGRPLIDPALIIDSGKGIIDDVVDLDKLLGANSIVDREINQALKERGIDDRGTLESMANEGGVPPAQQSGRALLLPSSAKESQ